jgi:hypothetical protein
MMLENHLWVLPFTEKIPKGTVMFHEGFKAER